MSNNLQKMMASKYPRNPSVMKSTAGGEESGTFFPKRIVLITLGVAVLFFILTLPQTYRFVGNMIPAISRGSYDITNVLDIKQVGLHTVIFAIVLFLALKFGKA